MTVFINAILIKNWEFNLLNAILFEVSNLIAEKQFLLHNAINLPNLYFFVLD